MRLREALWSAVPKLPLFSLHPLLIGRMIRRWTAVALRQQQLPQSKAGFTRSQKRPGGPNKHASFSS